MNAEAGAVRQLEVRDLVRKAYGKKVAEVVAEHSETSVWIKWLHSGREEIIYKELDSGVWVKVGRVSQASASKTNRVSQAEMVARRRLRPG